MQEFRVPALSELKCGTVERRRLLLSFATYKRPWQVATIEKTYPIDVKSLKQICKAMGACMKENRDARDGTTVVRTSRVGAPFVTQMIKVRSVPARVI